MELARSLWLAAPVILAGAVHIAALRLRVLTRLARPLDGGGHLWGHRVFGDNKTWRGPIVMALGSALLAKGLAWIPGASSLCVSGAQRDRPLLWGATLGLGYALGELPNSFLKRQLGIAPGAVAIGAKRALFWLLDQLDSLGGVILAARLFGPLPGEVLAWLVVVTLVVHPLAALVMVALGLKRRVG